MRDLAKAEFTTLRLRLIKVAARVIETASRVRLAFAAACPEADLFCGLPRLSASPELLHAGACAPFGNPYPSSAFPKSTVDRAEIKPNRGARSNSTNRKSSAGKPAFMNKGG